MAPTKSRLDWIESQIGSRIRSQTGSRIGSCKIKFLRKKLQQSLHDKIEHRPLWEFFGPKTPCSHFYSCVKECCVVPPWTKASKRYVSFNQSVEIRDTIRSCFLRSLTFFHCWCMRHIGSHSLQTDQPKCFTLQGQSLECYSRHKTFYKSLQYSTNEKLSSWHLVCHAFLSMTFAFCSCSGSVEALNCPSWKTHLNFWWKPKTKC